MTARLLKILQFPDARLRRRSKPVEQVTPAIRALAAEMLEVMYDEPGIGLAAPQLGEAIRLVVMDTAWSESPDAKRDPHVMLNPEIVAREGRQVSSEGCLSVPDFQAEVERAARVVARWTDLEGNPHEEDASELRAVCFQHEIDHLDGVLFIDRISQLKRSLYKKKRSKALKLEQGA